VVFQLRQAGDEDRTDRCDVDTLVVNIVSLQLPKAFDPP
jgi:hypothetical protein